MKKIIFICVVSLFFCFNSFAQQKNFESELAKNFKVDFAVSDAPAYKILGKEPSNLLRPSSLDVISFTVSSILNPSDISLPDSYAAEISPAMLIRYNKITLSEFINNYFFYNLRLSVGTTKDSRNKKYNLGVGLKTTIFDNGDLRKDEKYINDVLEELGNREEYKNTLQAIFNKICDCNITDSNYEAKFNQYLKKGMKEYDKDKDDLYKKKREEYKKNYWNKEKLEFAIAILGTSPDSLVKNVELKKYSVWSTFAYPISDWGQILVGGNFSYYSTTDKGCGSIASRLYGGNNSVKGYIEAQYQKDNNDGSKNILLSIGTELNLLKDIWINYYAGYEYNDEKIESKSDFISHFDIRFALE